MGKSQLIRLSGISCIIACVGDFAVMFFLGTSYPGYNQLKNTMSALGASASPVSAIISAWWIVIGLLFIFFGIGFKNAYRDKGKYVSFASWLIILYGVGEGIGSGLFKADHINNSLTTSAIIHDLFGGVGILAILILPLLMKKIILKDEISWFHHLSSVVFCIALLMLILFSFRFSENNDNFLNIYQGLWQRLMMLANYIYLLVIALLMLKKESFYSGSNKQTF